MENMKLLVVFRLHLVVLNQLLLFRSRMSDALHLNKRISSWLTVIREFDEMKQLAGCTNPHSTQDHCLVLQASTEFG